MKQSKERGANHFYKKKKKDYFSKEKSISVSNLPFQRISCVV
jgi:hypothetical protein